MKIAEAWLGTTDLDVCTLETANAGDLFDLLANAESFEPIAIATTDDTIVLTTDEGLSFVASLADDELVAALDDGLNFTPGFLTFYGVETLQRIEQATNIRLADPKLCDLSYLAHEVIKTRAQDLDSLASVFLDLDALELIEPCDVDSDLHRIVAESQAIFSLWTPLLAVAPYSAKYMANEVIMSAIAARTKLRGLLVSTDELRARIERLGPSDGAAQSLATLASLVREDNRIYPTLKPAEAVTGRMVYEQPNMHGLPKAHRDLILADEGNVIITADLKQIELRIAAALSQDPALLTVFSEGRSPHDDLAVAVFGDKYSDEQYSIAKAANFMALYGGGAAAIAKKTNCSMKLAEEVIETWRSRYPALNSLASKYTSRGQITLPSGRSIPARSGRSGTDARLNYLIQGTARDLFVSLVAGLYGASNDLARGILLLIHDEVVVQIPESIAGLYAAMITEHMTFTLNGVLIEADVKITGKSWSKP